MNIPFRYVIFISITLFLAVSYMSLNMSYVDNYFAIVAIFSWLAIVMLLSAFFIIRRVIKYHEIIFLGLIVPTLYVWCRILWFKSLTSNNFIAYTRLESYLEAYKSASRVVILDEHGIFYNLYVFSHVLLTLFNGNKLIYINVFIILEWLMTILMWVILLKRYKKHETHIAIIALALLSLYVAEIMIRAVAIFQIAILILLLHQLIQGKRMNASSSLILFIISVFISLEGPPARLILSATLSLIMFFSVLQAKHIDLRKIVSLIVIIILPILAITIYDFYSIIYIRRYIKYTHEFFEYSLKFIFGIEESDFSPLGFSRSAIQFSYPLSMILIAIRLVITLSYIVYVVFISLLSINYIIRRTDIVLRSISMLYLMFLTISIAGYLAQYIAVRPFDYFIVLQPRFFPFIIFLILIFSPLDLTKKFAQQTKTTSIAILLLVFTSLMSAMMLTYLNNDVPSAIILQEILSPFSYSGYSYDLDVTLIFLRDYKIEITTTIGVNEKTLCFLYSYIHRNMRCIETEYIMNLNLIYYSPSYILWIN